MSFLASAELGAGVGFGLFAIFSVLRYRTSPMPAREMTYLFTVIALPVVNSVLMQDNAWDLLLGVNAAITAVLFVLEREWGFRFEAYKTIKYDRIELIQPQHYAELLDDLRRRTGLPLTRVEVGPVNFVTDTSNLKVYFNSRQVQGHYAEEPVLVGEED